MGNVILYNKRLPTTAITRWDSEGHGKKWVLFLYVETTHLKIFVVAELYSRKQTEWLKSQGFFKCGESKCKWYKYAHQIKVIRGSIDGREQEIRQFINCVGCLLCIVFRMPAIVYRIYKDEEKIYMQQWIWKWKVFLMYLKYLVLTFLALNRLINL